MRMANGRHNRDLYCMMKNVSFIAPGEDSWAWRYPKKDRSRGFVWPVVEKPVNSIATDSVKMIIAFFYQ
jgi:hypothetical protein